MSNTTINPPPTPARGLRWVTVDVGQLAREVAAALPPQSRPLVDGLHADCCAVCTVKGGNGAVDTARLFVGQVADAVAVELADPPVEFEDPQLTPGQKRVFDADRDRLFRFMDRRPERTSDGALDRLMIVALLQDMASQAPAVDDVLAAEQARRRETAQARPTLALALGRNRGRN
jgi:hypothetical protein